MSDKESARVSFSKNKIGSYKMGSTGITGTPGTAIEPTAECEIDEDGNYSSSNLLFQNIDNLPKKLRQTGYVEKVEPKALSQALQSALSYDKNEQPDEEEVDEEEDWHDSSIEGLSEEDVVKNLSHHLGLDKKPEPKKPKISVNEIPLYRCPNPVMMDNFCRGCGQNFDIDDRFCGKCGKPRT